MNPTLSNIIHLWWTSPKKFITSRKNPLHPEKIYYIQKKSITSRKNPLHPEKSHCIQKKSITFRKNPLHPEKIHHIQKKSITSRKNPLHPEKIHYIQKTKKNTFRKLELLSGKIMVLGQEIFLLQTSNVLWIN